MKKSHYRKVKTYDSRERSITEIKSRMKGSKQARVNEREKEGSKRECKARTVNTGRKKKKDMTVVKDRGLK